MYLIFAVGIFVYAVHFRFSLLEKLDGNLLKERITKALISVGKKGLKEMIDDGEPIHVNCHFCNTDYTFEIDELKEIAKCSRVS